MHITTLAANRVEAEVTFYNSSAGLLSGWQ